MYFFLSLGIENARDIVPNQTFQSSMTMLTKIVHPGGAIHVLKTTLNASHQSNGAVPSGL